MKVYYKLLSLRDIEDILASKHNENKPKEYFRSKK